MNLDHIVEMIPAEDRNSFCVRFLSTLCNDKYMLYNVLTSPIWDNEGLNRCIRWRIAANLVISELAYSDTITLQREQLLILFHEIIKMNLMFGDQTTYDRIKLLMRENGRFSNEEINEIPQGLLLGEELRRERERLPSPKRTPNGN